VSASFRLWTSSFSTAREGYLSFFGIAQREQHHGLGTLLLDLTLKIMFSFYSCECVMTHIQKSNEVGFSFLQKRMFFAQRVEPRFYGVRNRGDEREDGLLLTKRVGTWIDELVVPEQVEIDEGIRVMLAGKQKLGWFARWTEPA
jgi:hypothetical protein